MTVASRTPEGDPHRCRICGEIAALEPSYPGGDSCCPKCGQLLWWFRDNMGLLGVQSPEHIKFSTSFVQDLGGDTLDLVEFIMEVEEKFDLTIPDNDAASIQTIADLIRYIRRRRNG